MPEKTLHSPHEIIAAYGGLSAQEQFIVQLCAVAYEAVSTASLYNCFLKAFAQFPDGPAPSERDFAAQLDRLQGLKLVDGTHQCHPDLIETATRLAVFSGRYPAMVKAVQRELPLKKPGYGPVAGYCPRVMRDLRIGFYSHDMDLFNRCFDELHSRCRSFLAGGNPVIQITTRPFSDKWFSTLPIGLQTYSLTTIFSHTMLHLHEDGAAYEYARRRAFLTAIPQPEKPNFYYGLVTRHMLAGQLDRARELISELESFTYSAGLRGWLHLLEGNYEKALASFAEDLKELRRRLGTRTAFFSGIAGVFYILALLKKKDAATLKEIIRFIAKAKSSLPADSSIYAIHTALEAICQMETMNPEEAQTLLKRSSIGDDALSLLFSSFATLWIEEKLSQERIDILSRIFIRSREIGLHWLAMECAELLCLAEQPTPIRRNYLQSIKEQTGMQPVAALIETEEVWHKRLRALLETVAPPASDEKSSSLRLVWLAGFHGGRVSLQAKEQKTNSAGGWSAGRPVALKRLYTRKGLDYLTHQDETIRSAVEKTAGYYYSPDYVFNMEKALPALVGHPLVFLEESPATRAEFVKGEPEIVVTQAPSELHIRLASNLADSRVCVVREAPTRFKVIELSEEQRRIVRIIGEKGLTVPEFAREKVLSTLAAISSVVTIHSTIGAVSDDIKEVEADSTPHIHLLPSGTGFRAEMFAKPLGKDGPYLKPGAGTPSVIAEVNGKRVQARRDLSRESGLASEVEGGCPSLTSVEEIDGQWLFRDPEDCLQFLLELKPLKEEGRVVVEWPEGEKLRIAHTASFDRLRMQISGRTDWFEVSGELRLDEERVLQMKELLDLVHASSGRFISLGEGEFIALTKELRKRLQELEAYADRRGKAVSLHPLAALAMRDSLDAFTHLEVDQAWKTRLERMEAGFKLTPALPSTLKAQLRDYQEEGYRWLAGLAHIGVGGCLADDMGLGKTVQALAVILDRAPHGPTLVVAPTSVCMNWIDEGNRFAPTLNMVSLANNDRENLVKGLKGFDVLVASYGILHQEAKLLSSVHWRTIVLDEAQAIKNVATKRSQAAMKLQSDFKLITTGTPIENHLAELWTLFNFINPGLLGSLNRFNERFAVPIEKFQNKDAKRRLKKLIQPFILRRTKAQVLEELPPRTEVMLQVEMSPEEASFYEALRLQALERLESDDAPTPQKHLKILAEIMRLRQAACNPRLILAESDLPSAKLELFAEIVAELLENNHKALVFSQFVGHLNLIRQYLDRQGIRYRYLDGSTPPKERKAEVDGFQAGSGDLFLISLKAGGLGLNLTAADYVIHMDPWWNPAVEDQASDRAHRIGQRHPVTVYRLVARNTIEEKIVKLHAEKRDLAGSLLEGSDVSGKISPEELLQLIRER